LLGACGRLPAWRLFFSGCSRGHHSRTGGRCKSHRPRGLAPRLFGRAGGARPLFSTAAAARLARLLALGSWRRGFRAGLILRRDLLPGHRLGLGNAASGAGGGGLGHERRRSRRPLLRRGRARYSGPSLLRFATRTSRIPILSSSAAHRFSKALVSSSDTRRRSARITARRTSVPSWLALSGRAPTCGARACASSRSAVGGGNSTSVTRSPSTM